LAQDSSVVANTVRLLNVNEGFWSSPNRRTLLRGTSRCGKNKASAAIESWCVDCTLEQPPLPWNHRSLCTRCVFDVYMCLWSCMRTGTSQLVTRSSRHTVKSCDELTVVSDGVVTSWLYFLT